MYLCIVFDMNRNMLISCSKFLISLCWRQWQMSMNKEERISNHQILRITSSTWPVKVNPCFHSFRETLSRTPTQHAQRNAENVLLEGDDSVLITFLSSIYGSQGLLRCNLCCLSLCFSLACSRSNLLFIHISCIQVRYFTKNKLY